MTKRSATTFLALLTLAGAASAASTPPAGAAAAAPCGIGEPIEGDLGEQIYLTAITHRKNVTCAVASKAAKGVSDVKLCKKQTTHNGWTVKNIDPDFLVARFSKGNKSFRVTSQGAC